MRRESDGRLIFIDHGYSFPKSARGSSTGLDEFRHTIRDDFSLKEREEDIRFAMTSPKMKEFLNKLKKWDVDAFATRWGMDLQERAALKERVFRVLDMRKSGRAAKLLNVDGRWARDW